MILKNANFAIFALVLLRDTKSILKSMMSSSKQKGGKLLKAMLKVNKVEASLYFYTLLGFRSGNAILYMSILHLGYLFKSSMESHMKRKRHNNM